jgi:excisionase family DNA binding protein
MRELLTVKEAAEVLKAAPKTVRKLGQSRSLKAIPFQRRWRIFVAAINDLLREHLCMRV